MKKYHANIKLPVPYVPYEENYSNKFVEKETYQEFLNKEFLDWIRSLGLVIHHGRFFNSPPFKRYPIHIDGGKIAKNSTKINLIFNSYDSIMNWYKPLDEGYIVTNSLGKSIVNYKIDKCNLLHSVPVNSHCIIDGSIPHDLVNGSNNGQSRKCYTLYLFDPKENTLLSWERAVELFDPYLID
jgi:hypothetical protein